MEILVPSFTIVFFFLALKRLDFAVFFIAATLPTYLIRFQLLGLPLTLLEVMILSAFAAWIFNNHKGIVERLKGKEKKRPYPFWLEIIALLIISFGALAVAGFSSQALGIWKAYFFEPIILFILAVNALKTDKGRRAVIYSLAFSAFLVSVFAIYQKFTGTFIPNDFWAAESTRRVVSFFEYPNAVGLFLAPITALLISFFFSLPYRSDLQDALKKIFLIITIVSSILAIYFAHSEGALIGLAAAIFVFALLAGKKRRFLALSFAFIFIFASFVYNPLGSYVKEKSSLADLSGQIRLRQWKETMMTLSGPAFIFGNGLSGYQEAVKPYHQEGVFYNFDKIENFDAVVWASSALQKKYWQPVEIYLYPHNIFLNFWSELGFIGALLFTWLIFRFLFVSYKVFRRFKKEDDKRRYISLGLMSSMIAILVHGLVDVPYFKNDLSAMFFILLALLGVLEIESKKK